jgi:methyl-accepting chemotaxis protein
MILLQKQSIPRRTDYALNTIISTSPWAMSWHRMYRLVFWLSDGHRDIERIACLLHKPEPRIGGIVEELMVSGYVSLHSERKVLMMNVALLKESFDMVAPRKEAFAHSFYERLFAYYPTTRALFANTDMKRQEGSLMATLAVVVAGVERGENLVPTLQRLGQKHYRYGARPEHYPLVGGVLLETFHEYLGTAFTPAMQDAWAQAFEIISGQMVGAGNL